MGGAFESDPSSAEIARAARILALRTRREATGSFAGSYASAFRGGGLEFDESQPYVPGDDVRAIDWSALARTGEPYVKRFKEERDQLLFLALDVSASMRFGEIGRSKSRVAAHTTSLLAAAAGHAGDRVGLVCFDDRIREKVSASRGAAHIWRLIQTAVGSARESEGRTDLASALDDVRKSARHRAIVVLLSDFRDPHLSSALSDAGGAGSPRARALRASLVALGRRHELVSIVVSDPREERLPNAGLIRVRDPERSGARRLLDSGSPRVRARYDRAMALRRQRIERGLRALGSDVLWMRTDRDPLRRLLVYFALRAAGSRSAS